MYLTTIVGSDQITVAKGAKVVRQNVYVDHMYYVSSGALQFQSQRKGSAAIGFTQTINAEQLFGLEALLYPKKVIRSTATQVTENSTNYLSLGEI